MKANGSEAFARAIRNPSRNYPREGDPRYRSGMIFPTVAPSFGIAPGECVFTIGSCFARNVEDALLSHGLSVPASTFSAPAEEAPGRPNRILNQYNPATMLQCVNGIVGPEDTASLYQTPEGLVIDPLLSTGARPVSPERAIERREQIAELYRSGLSRSGSVILTLGLVEAWYDAGAGHWLNEAPLRRVLREDDTRYEFHRMDTDIAGKFLDQILETLCANGRRVILTVSPVPLQTTFAEGDAVTRNAYSKSVLRVAAEHATQRHDRVDYFPSYEIVTTSGLPAFGDDHIHVRGKVVDRIIEHMINAYLASAPVAAA